NISFTHLDKLDGIRNWRQITVPSCWEAEFEDLVNYDGVAWYRRTLEIPAEWLQIAHNGKSRIIVHFDAVDYFARVWLNEYLLGEHEGGYLPFEFEIGAEALTALGVTEPSTSLTLTVQVIDPTDDRLHFPHYPMDEIPCGKQRWYINVGGIWQSVWLEHRPHIYVRNVHITPNDNLNGINVRVWLNHAPDVNLQGECIIISPDGNECVREVVSVEAGCTSFDFYVTIPAPQLWHPECPNLYKLRIELTNGDAYETAFGLRTVTTCGGCVYLNGEPIYLIGALDQDFYPDTIYRAPSDAYIEEQFKLAKQMGLNLLRCHIKIPERRYLDCADRIGLLIWYEVPSWWRFGERAKLRIRKHIQGMVERDYNHPSLIAYSIVNESWGVRLAEQELHRQWLVEMVNWLKQLDPTRLVIDNSPCRGNFHIKTDINDFHVYYNSPDHDAEFVQWVCDFDSRPEWTFSPHGDAAPKGDEPLIVSEFGLWGLPDIEALINHYGGKPWWFATGSDACRPEGV
ncbi:MAG TPA: glycoside hydrolase family 2, partial [Armatimonadetes bacterium]|nr:glycoside hydrolase family 2 [Armatimonadota bacterium]